MSDWENGKARCAGAVFGAFVIAISIFPKRAGAAQMSCEDPNFPRTASVALSSKPRPRVSQLSTQEARRRLGIGSVTVVDVRPVVAFAAGRLPGSRNIPLEDLDPGSGGLDRANEILVYDLDGRRSRAAAEKLAAAGFKVHELLGGIAGWVKKGYPLEVANGP